MKAGLTRALGLSHDAGSPLVAQAELMLEAGRGVLGDRYAEGRGSYSMRPDEKRQLTLIEGEKIEAAAATAGFAIDLLAPRRNVVVTGFDLEAALGRRLRLGRALIEILAPCPPCGRLDRLVRPGLLAALKGAGGVYARILEGGPVRLGDRIQLEDARPLRVLP